MATTYRLHYFGGRGRAEVSRLLFAAGHVQFEDVRYANAQLKLEGLDFATLKESGVLPFGQVPLLEIQHDGKTKYLAQSGAIVRYLACKFHLFGDCDFSASQIDSIYEGTSDIGQAWWGAGRGADAGKATEFYTVTFRKWLEFFNNFVADGADWMVGNRMSLADIAFFNICDAVDNHSGGLQAAVDEFPKLADIRRRVGEHLHHYLSHRPVTPL